MGAPLRPTYIITENHTLAAPLIDTLSLRRSREVEKFHTFSNESVLLVESRENPAVAGTLVGYLLGKHGYNERTRLFHLGRCLNVSADSPWPNDRLILVNHVVDAVTGRSYLPDILLAHEFQEAAVTTIPGWTGSGPIRIGSTRSGSPAPMLSDDPIAAEQSDELERAGFIDRELSGFLASALIFLAPHQVYCLAAIVDSDRSPSNSGRVRGLRPGEPKPDRDIELTEAVRNALPSIRRLIAESASLFLPARPEAGEEARRALAGIASALRLTTAQRCRLKGLVAAALAQESDVIEILRRWEKTAPIQSKQERKKKFDELEREFR